MKRFMIAVALAGTAAAGVAVAQTAAPTGAAPTKRGMFAPDANRDGVTTRAEALAAADARFASLDRNKDGKLTADERPGRRGGMTGDLTREQFRQAALTRFDARDTNKDGRIDQAEHQARRDRRGKGERHARGGMGSPGHGGARGAGMANHAMMLADTNKDGVITKAEFTAGAAQMFDRLDANRDGRIDQAERSAARERVMARRGGDMGAPRRDR